jgi:hypothetical protein
MEREITDINSTYHDFTNNVIEFLMAMTDGSNTQIISEMTQFLDPDKVGKIMVCTF